jgi:hypothetical protein
LRYVSPAEERIVKKIQTHLQRVDPDPEWIQAGQNCPKKGKKQERVLCWLELLLKLECPLQT